MDSRTITKALATVQDLLFGQGQVEQTRGGEPVTVDKINASHIPFSGDVLTGDFISVHGELLSRTKHVTSIVDLLTVNPLAVGTGIVTNAYHADLPGIGTTLYVWDQAKPKTAHNGGTVIDPTVVFPSTWAVSNERVIWYTANVAGTGCWIAALTPSLSTFGVRSDATDTEAILAANSALAFQPLTAYTAHGVTGNRPTAILPGAAYFDTTLGIPIWYNSVNWVDAVGNAV